MKKGSITVFLSLSLAGVMTFTFLLLDIARLEGQKNKAQTVSDIATMSFFADYNRYLWDNYRILAVDASYGSGGGADFAVAESRMKEYMIKNGLSPETRGKSLYQLSVRKCEITRYGLITDNGGRSFLKQAAKQQKSELPLQLIEEAADTSNKIEEASTGDSVDEMLEAGQKAIEESEEPSTDEKTDDSENVQKAERTENANNPMDDIKEWKNKTILSQVLPQSAEISENTIDMSEAVSGRTLARGNDDTVPQLTAEERILFADYEKTHFSNYTNDLRHDGLKYEWEYVLCGKNSDMANLSSTVERLLAVREMENLVSLRKSPDKCLKALNAAEAIAGWTGNQAIVIAVKWGLIASWAYMESVLDVRRLLDGGKISLIKPESEWTTDNLMELTEYFDVSRKAKEARNGITYEGYMLAMSAMQTDTKSGLRSLDLMENALKLQEHYRNCAMDQMVVSVEGDYEYGSEPAFFSLSSFSSGIFPSLKIRKHTDLSYLDDGTAD